MPGQVGGLGQPCPRLLLPVVFARVASLQCPSLGKEQVLMLCPTLTQKPCTQQYPIVSHLGLVDLQWEGFLRPAHCSMRGLRFFNFAMASVRLAMIFACCCLLYHSSGWRHLPSCQAILPSSLLGQFPVELPNWQRQSCWRSCG
jgi:hypothetical protein